MCQKADWNQHREACRNPKDFHPRDIVRVNGLVSKPEYNGLILQVMQLAAKEGRVLVKAYSAGVTTVTTTTITEGERIGSEISVRYENLTLIVPAEELGTFHTVDHELDEMELAMDSCCECCHL